MKTGMKKLGLVAVLFAVGLPLATNAALKWKETYYTKANIWYEHPSRLTSSNYHLGHVVPAGTPVTILEYSMWKGMVRFKDMNTGIDFTFTHIPRHSAIPPELFFDRYFSKTDVAEDIAKFSQMEQDNIKAGIIAKEMSKDAVFMAYGNPPSHRTPSLSCDRWVYWKSRFNRITVIFLDGKVFAVE